MASGLTDAGRRAFLRKQLDWENDDIRVLLVKDTYVFSAAHSVVADVVAHELDATDYARLAVAGRAVGTGSPTYATCTEPEWPGLGGAVNASIGGAYFYLHTGSDATALLIAFIDTPDLTTQDQLTRLGLTAGRVFSWGG